MAKHVLHTSPLALALTVFLTGCTATNTIDARQADLTIDRHQSNGWWTSLDNPHLHETVLAARSSAFDILIAEARLLEAEADIRRERASLLPSLDGFFSSASRGDRQGNVFGATSNQIGLGAQWQADVFGSARAAVSSAKASREASSAFVTDARRLVTGDVVALYITLQALNAEIQLAQQSLTRIETSLNNVSRLADAGYATDLDVQRSRAQAEEARATISDARARQRALVNQLSLLSGQSFDPAGMGSLPPLTMAVTTLPDAAVFIDNRPDVRAVSAQLEASAQRRASAQRALLPRLTFDASISAAADGDLGVSLSNLPSELVAQLAMPLIGRGVLLANVDAADARLQQAALTYANQVQLALNEVDDASSGFDNLRAAHIARLDAVAAASTALTQSRRLFSAGEISFLDVLVAEQTLSDAERLSLQSHRDALLAWVQLRVALGSDGSVT